MLPGDDGRSESGDGRLPSGQSGGLERGGKVDSKHLEGGGGV